MHILILPSAYPTEDAPLRSTFFKEQAIALKEAGHEVGVIYSETRRITGININSLKKFHFQIEDKKEEGINTIRLKGWNIFMMRNSLGINLWIKQTVKLFNIYIKKYGKPDLVHVHCGLYGGAAVVLIKEKYNIPYVITEHSSNVLNGTMDKYHRELLEKAYNNADYLISVGKKLKEKMKVYTKNKIEVIPNIVNTEKFTPRNKAKNGKFRFLSVSFLNPNKNVDLTIRAFSKAFKNKDNIELYIAGDGSERLKLEALAKDLGVESKVKFLGKVNREDLPGFLHEGNAFVLPSKYETFGVVYIEALACGLPIIATKCGGPEDFYKEDFGYMIDTGDEEALCQAMIKMIENKDKYDSISMSKCVKNRFSKEVIVKKIEEVYEVILN